MRASIIHIEDEHGREKMKTDPRSKRIEFHPQYCLLSFCQTERFLTTKRTIFLELGEMIAFSRHDSNMNSDINFMKKNFMAI